MSTVVTNRGRVTIPKAIRDHLGIRPGTAVEFRVLPDGCVMLVKTNGQPAHTRRKATRFAALRGNATVRMSTRQILALTRGEDWLRFADTKVLRDAARDRSYFLTVELIAPGTAAWFMGAAYALLGPTASGKSRLALELAARLPLEIVSLDSAQVYRGMDIGTAKPSLDERARVPHHLIDIADPDETYSAGRFRSDAIRAVNGILARGRIPLVVGGTMLYYRALVSGFDALPAADPAIRAAIDADAAARGWAALHVELGRIDPKAAQRIAPGDAQRIQRALEVWRLTGRALSSFQTGAGAELPFRLVSFAIVPPDRALLHRRIQERFDAMLEAGLIEEMQSLRRRYRLSANLPSMRCVGYRQVWSCLEGEYDRAVMRDKAIAATRQLAKRQMTWLRSFQGVEQLAEPDANQLAARMKSRIV